ncbi:MAG: VIT and VWA domain-containing protein [Bryobacteraceae bacterium]
MRLPLLLLLIPLLLAADSGVLIPSNRQQPDPAVLSLEELWVTIRIEDGDARVFLRQIFTNHTGERLEGTYLYSMPTRATMSDFAIWGDVTRIPGVIMERRRAEEIYYGLRWQSLDPGLLENEPTPAELRRSSVFGVKVVPILPYSTTRIELEYHETVPVENLKSLFALPLRPDVYQVQAAGLLHIDFELHSAHPITGFELASGAYPLKIEQSTPNLVKASYEVRNVSFVEDFAVRWGLESRRGDRLEVITHRDAGEPGFFEASALVRPGAAASGGGGPKSVTVLFDTSLSMQWDKLERNFQALETLLHSLRPADQFNLLLFNSEVSPFSPAPVRAETPAVERAIAFVKASRLRGGTNIERALTVGLAQPAALGAEPYLVLLTDGSATRGPIANNRLAAFYASKWKQAAVHPRTFVFAVGDDANMPLLRLLARADGAIEWVRSTEPVEFKLNAFLAKLGRRPVDQLTLAAEPAANFKLVYPLEDTVFPGSIAAWVGQYKQPGAGTFTARGVRDGTPLLLRTKAQLPATNAEHPQLPRTWARARVDALLEKIEREGEDRATIDEIIRLSRKYKFVTPYTAFLAAPRALLRPRLIRPGDPVLRVKTDPVIVSVVALFPFGLVKPLRYLPDEDMWQTRFLAPTDMNDGVYQVRLVLRDRAGRSYRESKSFVISSKPPVVRTRLDKARFQRGEQVRLRVSASKTTRTVSARMYGIAPVSLRWNPREMANTGEFIVPAGLPAGRYVLTVTAEDFAHNIGSQEVPLEVLP